MMQFELKLTNYFSWYIEILINIVGTPRGLDTQIYCIVYYTKLIV